MIVLSIEIKEYKSDEREIEKTLLPHPDGPTRATVLPAGILNDRLLRICEIEKHDYG
jgi:hypothetical protein